MKLTFLGTGTSTGVPQIGCHCEVCQSADPREKRLRASAIIQVDNKNLLVDCGPDFRWQMLREGAPQLDALLITHSHYDHVGGIDDLRPYCYPDPFPIYCKEDVAHDLRQRLPYCFAEKRYPGVPTFDIHLVDPEKDFYAVGVRITPLPVMHARLPIIGFRIGQLAYITDCSLMPETTIEKIKNIDTLVINALRHRQHMSHMNLQEALDVVKSVNPRQAFLTHISHDMGLIEPTTALLPSGVSIAVDGETVIIRD